MITEQNRTFLGCYRCLGIFRKKMGGKHNSSWFSLACKKKNSNTEHYKVMDRKKEMKEWLKPEWKHMTCESFHQHQTVQILLFMECLIVPLRVVHVVFWLQFKLVFYSSLSLQTVTGIKTLGKSAIDIRKQFHTEVKICFLWCSHSGAFWVWSYWTSLCLWERKKVAFDLLVFTSLSTVGI